MLGVRRLPPSVAHAVIAVYRPTFHLLTSLHHFTHPFWPAFICIASQLPTTSLIQRKLLDCLPSRFSTLQHSFSLSCALLLHTSLIVYVNFPLKLLFCVHSCIQWIHISTDNVSAGSVVAHWTSSSVLNKYPSSPCNVGIYIYIYKSYINIYTSKLSCMAYSIPYAT